MPKASPAPKELPKLLSVAEVAKALGCSSASVLRICGTGQLPSLKIGGRRKVAHHDVWVYLQSLRRKSLQEASEKATTRAALAKTEQTDANSPKGIISQLRMLDEHLDNAAST